MNIVIVKKLNDIADKAVNIDKIWNTIADKKFNVVANEVVNIDKK